ncbi:hopanoid-associated sugar epimerase [Paeniroseomonas aquatica]|uniref:NAD-dependent epimerase/dehydratase family protein n=1 Tax=Paeniroseomonas aquatica TaxID=373043 RepID=A0ABT8A9T9_9PROT|nr:hopanoid-associated sugar epimerase [Paeniroseomonas aquatica]MDN3566460.1 NAD-dependent epimerase/dehydratase family protein [Paeniroseomonas aquatica]
MAETVMLTGATGFLGSAIALALHRAGHPVRALVREGTPRDVLDGVPAAFIPGDLTDAASVARATEGCGAVIHCAADYRIFVPDPARMRAVNVAGTEAVMRAALAAGCRRVVHVSSVATLRPRDDGRPATEADAATPAQAIGPYKRSKTEAERLVERLVAEAGLPAVIVNPSTPIGPRDRRPTPTGRIILEAARGRMPAYVDTGLNLVHVDDVAAGCVAALTRGAVGERHILGGQDVPLGEMLAWIAASLGRRRPFRLPRLPLWPAAVVAEGWGRLAGGEPMLTLDGLRMAGHPMYFSAAKAERVLGHRARPWPEAVAEAIAWFRAQGMLPGMLPGMLRP